MADPQAGGPSPSGGPSPIDGPSAVDGLADEPGRPAGMCLGPGHIVVYANPALVSAFGSGCIGLPAREGILGLPTEAFAVLDAVFASGRPLARWIRLDDAEWRLTVAPRVDPGSGETYGVAFHLRARTDMPVVRPAPG